MHKHKYSYICIRIDTQIPLLIHFVDTFLLNHIIKTSFYSDLTVQHMITLNFYRNTWLYDGPTVSLLMTLFYSDFILLCFATSSL